VSLSSAIRSLPARLLAQPAAAPFVHRHDPARIRALQRAAARAAWLETLTSDQRRMALQTHGDIH
jgi:hypothetical protein